MKIKKRKKLEVSLLLGVLLLLMLFPFATAASYSRSNTPQYSPPMSSADYLAKQGIGLTPDWDEGKCEAGQDFLLQINPTGCTPAIVPSDILEEQNYAVFCPRSEERRVGKECRSRWSPYQYKKNKIKIKPIEHG